MRGGDPLADRSPFLLFLFGWYLRWYFRRHFHAVRIARTGLPLDPADRPLIIYSNHPSWWDPAVCILLGTTLLTHRVGYGPMEARELRRYGVLRRMGVFGIDPHTARGAAAFLQISRRVLEKPSGTLWVTAEGTFTDQRKRPVVLRPGIAHLARHVPDVVFLPLAIEYGFWNESRPEVLIRFGTPLELPPDQDVQQATAHLAEALGATMDDLAQDSMRRDPALFQPLLSGGAGVGGIYDVWRRLSAWASGKRFDAAHGSTASGGATRMGGND
jgi:1-acyl-sn-glycerol-3-phosphate acyltransferase